MNPAPLPSFAYPGFRDLYPKMKKRSATAERGNFDGYSAATEAEI